VSDSRNRHLMSVRRTVGNRPGFYGTSGTAWLAPTLDELPYPELWSARSTLD
jgi:tryptophan 2,3-dioxygenase